MKAFTLEPQPGGYYAMACERLDAPGIADDIAYLLDGDSYAIDHADLGYSLRSAVLVVPAEVEAEVAS